MRDRLWAARELPHLRPTVGTVDDEAAFTRHAVELAADYAVLGPVFMITVILLWWPIDGLLWTDDQYLAGFAAMRARGLLVMMVTLGLFLASSRVRDASLIAGPVAHTALLGCVGYSLGQFVGSDLAWFADAIVGILPAALLPLPLGPRIAATLGIGLSLPVGFFLALPEPEYAAAARGQLSFVAFSLLMTLVVGDILHRVQRRSFFQQRSLARARVELAELNSSLAERVAAQTAELRTLAGHLARTQETERRRISRDLHDELAQELTAMRYTLALLERDHERRPESVRAFVSDLQALLDGTTRTVRGFLSELRPRVLDDLGLVAAAQWLCERVRAAGVVDCRLTVGDGFPDGEHGLDPELALILFRALQEAMTNAQRHAHAHTIDVTLAVDGAELRAEVRDDGDGFDPGAPQVGFGLLGIRERVRGVGGRLTLESRPGHGTRITARVPLRSAAADDAGADPGEDAR